MKSVKSQPTNSFLFLQHTSHKFKSFKGFYAFLPFLTKLQICARKRWEMKENVGKDTEERRMLEVIQKKEECGK